jgi:hypothetical protein
MHSAIFPKIIDPTGFSCVLINVKVIIMQNISGFWLSEERIKYSKFWEQMQSLTV